MTSFSVTASFLDEMLEAYKKIAKYMPNAMPEFGKFVENYVAAKRPSLQSVPSA